MRQIYNTLKNWFKITFGESRDPATIILKLQEELNELNMSVQEYDAWTTHENRQKVQAEISDMIIVLIDLSTTYGVCFDSFVDGIKIKHNINRKRKWMQMPDGTWKHLPDGTTITYK